MNAKSLLLLIAATCFSLSAHAHDCSGGANGGMDATGNQCNDAAAIGTVVASDGATFPSSLEPKVETSKAASCNKAAVKRTSPTHHASVRSSRIKHG